MREDWEAIAKLDLKCRDLLAELVASETQCDQALRGQVEELSRLYEQLQRSGRAERERLTGELTRLNQAKQVTRAYKPLG